MMIYGAEAWTLKRSEEGLLERTEMRMLRWILGTSSLGATVKLLAMPAQ